MPVKKTRKRSWWSRWGPSIGMASIPLASYILRRYGVREGQRAAEDSFRAEYKARPDFWDDFWVRAQAKARAQAPVSGMKIRRAHDILGVPTGVAAPDLKKAYRAYSMKFHPDRPGGSTEKMKDLNEAFTTLKGHYKYSSLIEAMAFLEKIADVTSQDSGWASNPAVETPSRGNQSGDLPDPAPGTVTKRVQRKTAQMVGPSPQGGAAPPGPSQPAPPTPAAATTNTGAQGGPMPTVSEKDYQWLKSLGQRLGGVAQGAGEQTLGGVAWPFLGHREQEAYTGPAGEGEAQRWYGGYLGQRLTDMLGRGGRPAPVSTVGQPMTVPPREPDSIEERFGSLPNLIRYLSGA